MASLEFLASFAVNIDEFLFLPAAAGMWKQHGFRDGTCTLDDLPDITGLIRVRRENEKRAADAAQGSDLFFRVFLPAGPDKPECIILIILRNNFYSNTAVLKLTPLPD